MTPARIAVVRMRATARVATSEPSPAMDIGGKASDDHMIVFFILGLGVAAAMLLGAGVKGRG